MFKPADIIYEDNHIIVVNKRAGDLVQPDAEGQSALENEIKDFIKKRDEKPGAVYLGVVHRIDRPVSGAVMFAKTSKALVRLNEMLRKGEIDKRYWAIVEELPEVEHDVLVHHIVRDGKTNRSRAHLSPKGDSKEARLEYKMIAGSSNYYLLEVKLFTGRHHQIRCQLSKIGCPIKGDLKYGARRSNPDGGIMLHSRSLTFMHPVRKEMMSVVAPVPTNDNLWEFFDSAVRADEE
jgi:23S rRNA pseudouridine1911/1915/1917 synthase